MTIAPVASELELHLAYDLRELSRAHIATLALYNRHGTTPRVRYLVDFAIEEVVSNIIRHSHREDTVSAATIAVRVNVDAERCELHFIDPGPAFDPLQAPEPDLQLPLAQRRVGGVGLPLLRRMMTAMRYERAADANHLHLTIADEQPGPG